MGARIDGATREFAFAAGSRCIFDRNIENLEILERGRERGRDLFLRTSFIVERDGAIGKNCESKSDAEMEGDEKILRRTAILESAFHCTYNSAIFTFVSAQRPIRVGERENVEV